MSIMKKSITAALFFSLGLSVSASAETYKLGFSGAITGPTSDAGVPYSRGVNDYCAHVNDKKLLGSDKLECLVRDDGYKNDVTKRNFEEFLDEEIVLFLGYSTGATLALKNDYEEEQIPVIPASMHADNTIKSNYIFLPIASYSEQALGLVEYAARQSKSPAKIALFLHPSAFGRAPIADIEKAIKIGLNAELVEVVEHGKGLDNTAMLKRLSSKGVQYIISHTVQAPVSTMLKDAKRLGLIASTPGEARKMTFMGAHYTGGSDLNALAGDAAEGYIWTTSYRLTHESSSGADFMKSLGKAYNRDEKTTLSHNYTNGVMVTQVAVEAMVRAKAKGDVNRETVTAALNAMNGNNGYDPLTTVGPVTFSKSDRSGVDTLELYQVKKGKFQSMNQAFQSEYMSKIR